MLMKALQLWLTSQQPLSLQQSPMEIKLQEYGVLSLAPKVSMLFVLSRNGAQTLGSWLIVCCRSGAAMQVRKMICDQEGTIWINRSCVDR